jgi:hypothetical protein
MNAMRPYSASRALKRDFRGGCCSMPRAYYFLRISKKSIGGQRGIGWSFGFFGPCR